MSKNIVKQWDKNGNTYLKSEKTGLVIKRKAGTRGRPSYSEADVKAVPDTALELDAADVSTQARRALGLEK